MSLKFYNEVPLGYTLITDVEDAYISYQIQLKLFSNLELANNIISYIDGSRLDENGDLFDRFGVEIAADTFSTGCKCALLTAFLSDANIAINTKECGWNAIVATILFCREGNLVHPGFVEQIYWNGKTSEFPIKDCTIDVLYNNNLYTTVYQLNHCISECGY